MAAVAGGLFAHAAPSRNGGVKQVENVDDYIVVRSSTTVPTNHVLSASLIAPAPQVTEPSTTVATTDAPPPATPAPTAAPTHQAVAPATAGAPEMADTPSSSAPHHHTQPTWQPPDSTGAPTQHEYEHEPEDSQPHGTEPGDD